MEGIMCHFLLWFVSLVSISGHTFLSDSYKNLVEKARLDMEESVSIQNSTSNSSLQFRSRRSPRSSCSPNCQLPNCFCGLSIPGDLTPAQTPQLVLLTFDDAVNDLNKEFYQRLFSGRRNPDGCNIMATFFVSHEWTDYSQVQDLYSQGHEMASHTVTHSQPHGRSVDGWAKEAIGLAELLVQYAGVDPDDVRGVRAPFLETGGDPLFSVLSKYGLWYDSSLSSQLKSPPLWPYTLDHDLPHSCAIPPCPTSHHPGVWEIPLTYMEDGKGGHCPMLDGCTYTEDVTSIQRMLTANFLRFYTSNKAPFPMAYHAAWFRLRPHREQALHQFLDSILELPDVYLVTNQAALQWIRAPTPLPGAQPALSCPTNRSPSCSQRQRQRCNGREGRGFFTCSNTCPESYPWVQH